MEELVVGVPARDEGGTIEDLADALELGSAGLGEEIRCELVLAYQPGIDDTLKRWESHPFRIRSNVLRSPEGTTGKGRNVKALIRYAHERESHLLLVDGDFRSYPPSNVARFVNVHRLSRGGLALPLWSRPRGQGNSTDFLACPLLFAAFGALVRQPLAGHMLLTKRMLANVDIDSLPDDYGIDIALTIHALSDGLPVDQVLLICPDHDAGEDSHRIMEDVAYAMLRRLKTPIRRRRSDVMWPVNWWQNQPLRSGSSRDLRSLVERLAPAYQLDEFGAMLRGPSAEVQEFWGNRLAEAVRAVRAGGSLPAVVRDLVGPFLVHAEYRRRVEVDIGDAEAYVSSLCTTLAEVLA